MLASDEARELDRQVVVEFGMIDRAKGRELAREALEVELAYVFGTPEVLEAVLAEVTQLQVVGQLVAQKIGCGLRDEDLPPLGDAGETSHSIDRGAEVVTASLLALAGM